MADLLGTEISSYPLIPAKIASAVSNSFIISDVELYNTATITANGLSEGEVIPVQIQAFDESWSNASTVDPLGGSDLPLELRYLANSITVSGAGRYRVNKPVTTSEVSVTLYRG